MKRREREEALHLRHRGYSLKSIAEQIGVSKSTVSLWVRDLTLSSEIQQRIRDSYSNGQRASQAAIRARTQRHLHTARKEAEIAIKDITINRTSSLIFCALLYWCEGGKSRNDDVLTFSNSDPLIVKAYMTVLRDTLVLEESKFRVVMHLHDYHNVSEQIQFWSKITSVPHSQFQKTYIKPHTRKQIRPGYQGCVHIKYYDVVVARKIAATARAVLTKVIEKDIQGL